MTATLKNDAVVCLVETSMTGDQDRVEREKLAKLRRSNQNRTDELAASEAAEVIRAKTSSVVAKEQEERAAQQQRIQSEQLAVRKADIDKRLSEGDLPVYVTIAARNVVATKNHMLESQQKADGLPPVMPISGYYTRLTLVGILELPVFALAFVYVADCAPVVALFSAIALALFLMVGGHLLGKIARIFYDTHPKRAIAAAAVVGTAYIGLLLLTTLELRSYSLNTAFAAPEQADIFAANDSAQVVINGADAAIYATAMVTIGALLLAIYWGARMHSPQVAYALAERSYQRALLELDGKKAKAGLAASFLALLLLLPSGRPEAAECSGGTIVALIDVTTSFDDTDKDVARDAMNRMVQSLPPSYGLVIKTVNSGAEASRVIFNQCAPDENGSIESMFRSRSSLQEDLKTFQGGVAQAVQAAFSLDHNFPATALAETLISALVYQPSSIWVITDLLETKAVSVKAILSGRHDVLKNVFPDVSELDGVKVFVAGHGRFHDKKRRPLSGQEIGDLQHVWGTWLQANGADVTFF